MSRKDDKRIRNWLRRQRQIEWDNISPGDQEDILRASRKIDDRVGRHVRKITSRVGASIHSRAPKGRALVKKRIKGGVKRLFLGETSRRRRRVK